MSSFVIGRKRAEQTQVIDMGHPPIVRALRIAGDQGEVSFGAVLAVNADDEVMVWDGATGMPKGVLTENCNAATDGIARVLVHGMVVKQHVTVAGVAITVAQLGELEAIGIWAN